MITLGLIGVYVDIYEDFGIDKLPKDILNSKIPGAIKAIFVYQEVSRKISHLYEGFFDKDSIDVGKLIDDIIYKYWYSMRDRNFHELKAWPEKS